jgi:hypothetical protein
MNLDFSWQRENSEDLGSSHDGRQDHHVAVLQLPEFNSAQHICCGLSSKKSMKVPHNLLPFL